MPRGYELVARALANEGVNDIFFIVGGPMVGATNSCADVGIRMIDVHHEQGATFMAQAYARVKGVPGVCMAASGPATANFSTGLANALVDGVPVVAIGGSSPISLLHTEAFQEIDQVAMLRPVTKWAERCLEAKRIPEYVSKACRQAMSGKPGPVYLDLPGDVLYSNVEEADVRMPRPAHESGVPRPAARDADVERFIAAIERAERPIILSGSGMIWSGAAEEYLAFVEKTGIPFYATPQGRGVVPDDHPYSYLRSRSVAMKEADLVIILGTRINYVVSNIKEPRFARDVRMLRIDIDHEDVHCNERLEVGIVADLRTALAQIGGSLAGRLDPKMFEPWRDRLAAENERRRPAEEQKLASDAVPIHPLRLCKEVRDFMDRDAILAVDGQEILNYGRQSIPSFLPGHRINSGPFGTMGVGLPFGLGAKAAKPDKQVIVLHGDGSFGMNAMEIATSIRHNLPVLVVISLNGGWAASQKVGRELGYLRYHDMAAAFDCHGEYVERPEDIRPALERAKAAVARGQTAVVNVKTDHLARATTANFTQYST